MQQIIMAVILVSSIIICGIRRIKLLNIGFAVQSLAIAVMCLVLGCENNSYHYYILFLLTLIVKAILIPYIINKSVAKLRANREMSLIINGYWSYVIAAVGVTFIYGFLINYNNDLLKIGIVLMMVGGMLLIGRKKAITEMIGFLIMENGLVLLEISMIKMTLIIELAIVLEVLVLALIMGIMIFYINQAFDSINTDRFSDIKE